MPSSYHSSGSFTDVAGPVMTLDISINFSDISSIFSVTLHPFLSLLPHLVSQFLYLVLERNQLTFAVRENSGHYDFIRGDA